MTIETTTNRLSFSGDGVTTAFSFPHYLEQDADIKVIQRVTATGVETTKTLTTHYTVSGTLTNGVYASGVTVTMLVSPPVGTTLTLYRDPAIEQGLDLAENDSLPAESVEQALDRLTAVSQRLDDRLDRAVRLSEGYAAAFDPSLPAALVASTTLVIKADLSGFETGPTVEAIEDAEANAIAAAASEAAAAASAAAAATAETNAETAETNAETAETNAETAQAAAAASAAAAAASAAAAAASETAAETAETNAETAETNAETAETNAETAATAAAGSAAAAAASAAAAATAETNAETAETNAETAETNAAASAAAAAASAVAAAVTDQPYEVSNVGLTATVAANALTITLKTKSGGTPAVGDGVKIGFRTATLATGTYVQRQISAAPGTLVVPSGATLGHRNGIQMFVHVYAIDNAGTVELAVTGHRILDEGKLHTTVAITTGADFNSGIYSTSARTDVAVRYIGSLRSTQATAGVWASAVTEITLTPQQRRPVFWLADMITRLAIPRVTATPVQIGEYRTMKRSGASAHTTIDDAITTVPTSLDGLKIFGNFAYNVVGTVGASSKWVVFIGLNAQYEIHYFRVAGRTGYVDATYGTNAGTTDWGLLKGYDPSTGVLVIDGNAVFSSSNTTRSVSTNLTVDTTAPAGGGNIFWDALVWENV